MLYSIEQHDKHVFILEGGYTDDEAIEGKKKWKEKFKKYNLNSLNTVCIAELDDGTYGLRIRLSK